LGQVKKTKGFATAKDRGVLTDLPLPSGPPERSEGNPPQSQITT
jgi:hypothetical protein